MHGQVRQRGDGVRQREAAAVRVRKDIHVGSPAQTGAEKPAHGRTRKHVLVLLPRGLGLGGRIVRGFLSTREGRLGPGIVDVARRTVVPRKLARDEFKFLEFGARRRYGACDFIFPERLGNARDKGDGGRSNALTLFGSGIRRVGGALATFGEVANLGQADGGDLLGGRALGALDVCVDGFPAIGERGRDQGEFPERGVLFYRQHGSQ